MSKPAYVIGRFLQVLALITMPSAMWVAQFEHNEPVSIGLFLGSLAVFYAGYGLTRMARRGS